MPIRGIGLFSALAQIWRVTFEFGRVLNPCRFSALVVVLGGAVLLATAQGQEIVVRLAEAGAGAQALFVVAIALWAFQSWYWSHYVLDLRYAKRRPSGRVGFFVTYLPRLLGFTAFLIAAAATAIPLLRAPVDARMGYLPILFAVVISGCAFGALLIYRERLTRWLATKPWAKGWLVADPSKTRHFGDYPLSRALVGITIVQAAVMTVWIIIDPASAGAAVGAPAIFFLALASIVPVGSYLVIRSQRLRFPVVTSLGVLAFAMSFFNDNHLVRPYSGSEPPLLTSQRATVVEAVQRWRACRLNGEIGAPLVVVATAGGGLRAAYWTATVLGTLQDVYPAFSDRLFAISGVSGGSLGAAVYASLLREHGFGCSPRAVQGPAAPPGTGVVRSVSFAAETRSILGHDFLGPTIAGLLYPDLMQRFLPGGFLPDRALALEKSFERGWLDATPPRRTAGLASSFLSLWRDEAGRDPGHRPALLLKGTHQETGRRIVTSNLKIDADVFVDVYDFHELADGDIHVSTAVTNSARFPYVTPAGSLRRADVGQGHILDGGFFENFGAVTAAEVLRSAMWAVADRPPRPLVIMISSDPDLGDFVQGTARAMTMPADPDSRSGGNELFAPPIALYATRNARGILAVLELERLTTFYENEGRATFAHFRMCRLPDAEEPALGWVLSHRSEVAIAERMLCTCGNDAAFATVLSALDRRNAHRPPPQCVKKN
jgi:hypothetical protein